MLLKADEAFLVGVESACGESDYKEGDDDGFLVLSPEGLLHDEGFGINRVDTFEGIFLCAVPRLSVVVGPEGGRVAR